jgi:SAM-dependent methyltransferase
MPMMSHRVAASCASLPPKGLLPYLRRFEVVRRAIMPVKFKRFYASHRRMEFQLLDIGCGNHSATSTKRYFPNCRYHGLDKGNYNNDDADFAAMEKFYQVDLASGDLSCLPDSFFDVIICSHVIEHLRNGLEVIGTLASKLARGGKIYVEFPSVASLNLPSMAGTLQFCDDPTHVRLYSVLEVCNALLDGGLRIVAAGRRRDAMMTWLFPLYFAAGIWRYGKVTSFGLWDPLGFADFVYAERPPANEDRAGMLVDERIRR